MSYRPSGFAGSPAGGGFGAYAGSPPPRDVVVLLVVVFVTFSLQFFGATAGLIALLRLTPLVVRGFLWQILTYPFVGVGGPSLWFLLELLILYWFGRDVFYRLGRRRFWTLVGWAAGLAGAIAATVYLVVALVAGAAAAGPAFALMQGQRMLLTILIAAFATLYAEATILLFFVLPLKARWFLWLEIVIAFLGFLGSKDLPGFIGVCAAVGVTWALLVTGGPFRPLRRTRKRLEQWWLERRLGGMRKRRDFDVIEGGGKPDRWVH